MLHSSSSNKTAPTRAHNLWLLDATGQIIDHDSLADSIILKPFNPRQLPGLVLCSDEPLSSFEGTTPLRGYFHKRISLPFPLPESEIIPSSHGLITLRNAETNHNWLTFTADENILDFTATHLDDARHFLPLTLEGFTGLSYLIDQGQAEIRAVNQRVVGPACFSSERPYHILLGESEISLTNNLAELTRLGQLTSGQEDVITLQKDDDPSLAYTFIIRINT